MLFSRFLRVLEDSNHPPRAVRSYTIITVTELKLMDIWTTMVTWAILVGVDSIPARKQRTQIKRESKNFAAFFARSTLKA